MSRSASFAILFAVTALGFRADPPSARAEDAAGNLYSAAELKELVGPIALYPDLVVASLLPATTFPTQVTEAAAYLAQRGGTVAEVPADTTWDSSVQALLQYPDLLVWLRDNPDWVAQMGFAVANQQADVLAAVQAFRAEAQAAGNLTSDSHQVVTTADTSDGATQVIVIQPADPTIVYLPTYSPVAVVRPGYVWPWGLGFAMGVTGAWAYNNIRWGSHGGDINVSRDTTVNINRGGNSVGDINIGNDVGPNRPTKWNASNRPAQRPAGGVAQPKAGGWGNATGSRPSTGVKPRPPVATAPNRPGATPGPAARPTPMPAPTRPTPAPTRPAPGVARPSPAPTPAPRPAAPGGFGGATNGATTRAVSDRGGSSLKQSGGGASGGGSFKGQTGRGGGGGGGRGGGGGGRRQR